ncbi:MAG: arylamine N-acetyltransferase [Actinomycetota bacterium]
MTTVDAYLERIGAERPDTLDLAALAQLQHAHLVAVPFENLDVFHRVPVSVDQEAVLAKIVGGRGGWCFENNGAFAWLLDQLGFMVRRLGAAVLIDGPNTLIDHHTIEVQLDSAHLVDVGFGDSFTVPLDLNHSGPQDGGKAPFEFLASPQGTTLTEHEDGVPAAKFRFKRVAHPLADFAGASQRLFDDTDAHWQRWPFATRLLGDGADRVTLLADRLKVRRGGVVEETDVAEADWDDVLWEWFRMSPPV